MRKLLLLSALCATTGAYAQQPLQGDLDTWRNSTAGFLPTTTVAIGAPNGWNGSDSIIIAFGQAVSFLANGNAGNYKRQLFRETGSVVAGASAARLMSRDQDTFGIVPCLMVNARINVDFGALTGPNPNPVTALTFSGGTPLPAGQRVDSVTAWVRFVPRSGTDAATVFVQVRDTVTGGNDSTIGLGILPITGTQTSYQRIRIGVNYIPSTRPAERIIVGFISGQAEPTGADSTQLYVDEVSFTTVTGIELPVVPSVAAVLYPNPTTDGAIHLRVDDLPATLGTLRWMSYDATGRLVADVPFKGTASLDASAFVPGVYVTRLVTAEGRPVWGGQFSVQH